MQRLENSSTTPILTIKKQEKPLIAKEDWLLCASNLLFTASLVSDSPLLRSASNISNLVIAVGESIASVKSWDELHYAFPSIILAGARIVIVNQMAAHPALKPLALAINAYGTGVLAHKCINFYKSSKQYTWQQIAQLCLVHGVNTASSAYRTALLFHDCQQTFFPKSNITPLSEESAKVPATEEEEQQFMQVIEKMAEPIKENKISLSQGACRILYYDPTCKTLDQKGSSCAPDCTNLTKEEINEQAARMTRKYFNKREGGFDGIKRTLLADIEASEETSKILSLSKNKNKLSEDEVACRTLFGDPTCETLDQKSSECAPTCEKFEEWEISSKSRKLKRQLSDQKTLHASIDKAQETLIKKINAQTVKLQEQAVQIQTQSIKDIGFSDEDTSAILQLRARERALIVGYKTCLSALAKAGFSWDMLTKTLGSWYDEGSYFDHVCKSYYSSLVTFSKQGADPQEMLGFIKSYSRDEVKNAIFLTHAQAVDALLKRGVPFKSFTQWYDGDDANKVLVNYKNIIKLIDGQSTDLNMITTWMNDYRMRPLFSSENIETVLSIQKAGIPLSLIVAGYSYNTFQSNCPAIKKLVDAGVPVSEVIKLLKDKKLGTLEDNGLLQSASFTPLMDHIDSVVKLIKAGYSIDEFLDIDNFEFNNIKDNLDDIIKLVNAKAQKKYVLNLSKQRINLLGNGSNSLFSKTDVIVKYLNSGKVSWEDLTKVWGRTSSVKEIIFTQNPDGIIRLLSKGVSLERISQIYSEDTLNQILNNASLMDRLNQAGVTFDMLMKKDSDHRFISQTLSNAAAIEKLYSANQDKWLGTWDAICDLSSDFTPPTPSYDFQKKADVLSKPFDLKELYQYADAIAGILSTGISLKTIGQWSYTQRTQAYENYSKQAHSYVAGGQSGSSAYLVGSSSSESSGNSLKQLGR